MKLPALFYICILSVLVLPIVGSLRWRVLSRDLRILLGLVLFDAIIELVQLRMAFLHLNNLWTSHIYHVVEFVLLSWALWLWEENALMKKVLTGGIIVYILFWLISKITFEPFDKGGATTSIVSHIFFTFFSVRLLHVLVGRKNRLLVFPKFWMLAGLLIYSSGDLLVYCLRSIIEVMPVETSLLAWQFHWIVNLIANILFATGFLVAVEPRPFAEQRT